MKELKKELDKELDKEHAQELDKEHVQELDKELRGPTSVFKQKNLGRVEAGKRLQSLMKERRAQTSGLNKYYIGAGVLVVVILYLVNQRSDDDSSLRNDSVLLDPRGIKSKLNQFDSDI